MPKRPIQATVTRIYEGTTETNVERIKDVIKIGCRHYILGAKEEGASCESSSAQTAEEGSKNVASGTGSLPEVRAAGQ